MADQVCTLAQVKARLTIADATDDALIGELIDEVTDWLQDVTKRKLVPEAGGQYLFDTSAGSVINVPRGIRAISLLAVGARDQGDTIGSWQAAATIPAAEFVLRPSPVNRRPGWPAYQVLILGTTGRLGNYLNGAFIEGDYGFATTPPAIQGVAIDAVVAAYRTRKAGASNVIGSERSTVVPWSSYFADGSPQRATVDLYRGVQGIG